jgi:Uma2 family endonuclease
MASALRTPPFTIHQYLAFESPEGYRDELLYGRIILSPDPKPLHLDIAENTYRLLRSALGRKYKVGQRINLKFPDENSMPSPDVFVMEQKAWNTSAAANQYPGGKHVKLVVEILSPGNRAKQIQQKATLYATHGIEVWIVDPKLKQVKVNGKVCAIDIPLALSKKSIAVTSIFKLPYDTA